jgi:hypothetical protein
MHFLLSECASAYSSGPPTLRTGAPGEVTCAICHNSFSLNSGPGTLSITGLPPNYSPNQELTLTLTIAQPNRDLFGFQLTALDESGRQAGTIVVTDDLRTQLVVDQVDGKLRQYLSHTFPGTVPMVVDQGNWAFKWRAPATSIGKVTFYVAGNAANGNGGSSGDYIYTYSVSTLPPLVLAALNPATAAAGDAAFTLNVTGEGFVPGAVVRWNGSDRMTNFVSGSQLTASITVADVVTPGMVNVTVANPGFGVSNALVFTINAAVNPGYEADVSPRPNGSDNGTVTISDWVQVGRFASGLDTAEAGSEFQRADCAPVATLGNGSITISDWVQAGRYAAGLDAVVRAGGPAGLAQLSLSQWSYGNLMSDPAEADALRLRIERAASSSHGLQRLLTYVVELDARGGENALGFSLRFDAMSVRVLRAVPGNSLAGAVLNVNASQASDGRIGFAIALPAGKGIASGPHQAVVVTFIIATDEVENSGSVALGDEPVAREVVDVKANSIAAPSVLERLSWYFNGARKRH